MHRLLALDLDGTLLNSNNQISLSLQEAIRNVPDNIVVMIVTGRHHTAAKPYYDQLNLRTPIICCNGTYIYDYQTSTVSCENSIPKEHAREFLLLCDQYGLKKIMYVSDSMLYDALNPTAHMERLRQWSLSFCEPDRPSILKISDFETPLRESDYVWKFLVEGEDANITEFSSHPFIQREFIAEQSFVNRIDYSRKGNSKGNRLREYINSQGIEPEQIVAIGDNHNDISMIQVAGMGVTLDHADDVVKQEADLVLDSNNNDEHGLANFIHSLFNQRRSV